jgi:hypothetical protein
MSVGGLAANFLGDLSVSSQIALIPVFISTLSAVYKSTDKQTTLYGYSKKKSKAIPVTGLEGP